MVLFLGAAFAISITLGVIAAAIPVLIGASLATHRAQRRLADENFQALAAKSSTLGETVANAATIKALGLEAEVEKRWQARAEQAAWTNFRANHLANVAASASGILQLVALLALVVVGTHQVVDHRLTIGGLIAANMLATRALQPMRQLAAAWHQLQAVGAAFKRIDELMREAVESPPGELAPMPPLTGQISLDASLGGSTIRRRPSCMRPTSDCRRGDHRHRRPFGLGQDHHRQSRGACSGRPRSGVGRRDRDIAFPTSPLVRQIGACRGYSALHRIGAREHRDGRSRQRSRSRRRGGQVRRRP